MNYIFFINYNGIYYKGSQTQLNFFSIHDIFLHFLFKFKKKIFKIIFSSRTDKGVSSLFQIIYIFNKNYFFKNKIIKYFNNNCKDINILNIIQISKKFHSIYSVLNRIYCYVFNFLKNIFINYAFYLNYNLNIYFLIYFLKHILGFKNFFIFDFYKNKNFFNSSRIIYEFNFYKKNNYLYLIFKGNSFLYNMIRNIIIYLLYIVYNNYSFSLFINLFYLKKNIFFLLPIKSNYLFLIYINYLL